MPVRNRDGQGEVYVGPARLNSSVPTGFWEGVGQLPYDLSNKLNLINSTMPNQRKNHCELV